MLFEFFSIMTVKLPFIKRLEHGKFKIQESQESLTRAITSRQLSWLLEGLEYDEKLKEKQLLI